MKCTKSLTEVGLLAEGDAAATAAAVRQGSASKNATVADEEVDHRFVKFHCS
jgi:hypothetical protein